MLSYSVCCDKALNLRQKRKGVENHVAKGGWEMVWDYYIIRCREEIDGNEGKEDENVSGFDEFEWVSL